MPSRSKKQDKDSKPQTPAERFRKVFASVGAPMGGLPTMKTKVSDLTLDELGDYTARYAAWREYCEDMHLMALSDFMEVKARYDMKLAELMITIEAPTVTEKRSRAEADQSIAALSKEYTQKEMYYKMISHKLESFTNSLSILSRELTRRGISNF